MSLISYLNCRYWDRYAVYHIQPRQSGHSREKGERMTDIASVGGITIGNLRNRERSAGAVPIRVDRTSGSPLGNPFHMQSESQRDEVCNRYADWFHGEIRKGNEKVLDELQRILNLVKQGKDVELLCWCAPRKCHAETVRAWLTNNLCARKGEEEK